MEHAEIRRKLSAYLDNAVGGEEKEEIKRHLKSCGSCQGEIADLELTVGYLKTLPSAEPPPWLTAKIMAKVRESAGPGRSLWQRLFFPLHVKLPLEAFALVFLCITGVYLARMVATEEPLTAPPPPARKSPGAPPPPPMAPSRTQPESAVRLSVPPAKPAAPRPAPPPFPATELPAPPKAGGAQPAPARPAQPAAVPELEPMDEGPSFERDAAPLNGREEKLAPALGTNRAKRAGKTESAAGGESGAAQLDKGEITLAVDDPDAAVDVIEETATRYGGRIIGHSYSGESHLLIIRIGTQKIPALVERLGHVGTVLSRPHPPPPRGAGMTDLTIRW